MPGKCAASVLWLSWESNLSKIEPLESTLLSFFTPFHLFFAFVFSFHFCSLLFLPNIHCSAFSAFTKRASSWANSACDTYLMWRLTRTKVKFFFPPLISASLKPSFLLGSQHVFTTAQAPTAPYTIRISARSQLTKHVWLFGTILSPLVLAKSRSSVVFWCT